MVLELGLSLDLDLKLRHFYLTLGLEWLSIYFNQNLDQYFYKCSQMRCKMQ